MSTNDFLFVRLYFLMLGSAKHSEGRSTAMAEPLWGDEDDLHTVQGEPTSQRRTAAAAAKPSGGVASFASRMDTMSVLYLLMVVTCLVQMSRTREAELKEEVESLRQETKELQYNICLLEEDNQTCREHIQHLQGKTLRLSVAFVAFIWV